VWQQVEEFGSFAAVGYEEDCVVLRGVLVKSIFQENCMFLPFARKG
jgi:hypothetical protein